MKNRIRRSAIVRDTHFAGSTLDDLREVLKEWQKDAHQTVARFEELDRQLGETKDWQDDVDVIRQFIAVYIDRFGLYLRELECLSEGIEVCVLEGHAALVEGLWSKVDEWRTEANEYFADHIGPNVKDERLKHIVNTLYWETMCLCDGRMEMIYLGSRLRLFIGRRPTGDKKMLGDYYRIKVLEIIRREIENHRDGYRQILAALDEDEATLHDSWFVKITEDFSEDGKMGKQGKAVIIKSWRDIAKYKAARARFQTWLSAQKKKIGSR